MNFANVKQLLYVGNNKSGGNNGGSSNVQPPILFVCFIDQMADSLMQIFCVPMKDILCSVTKVVLQNHIFVPFHCHGVWNN
jgi:hypothetical protein